MPKKKKITITEERYRLEHETLIIMSADIYDKIYQMEYVDDWNQAADLLRDAALRFEDKWKRELSKKENADYFIEMEKFEDEELERLRRDYDEPDEEDEASNE